MKRQPPINGAVGHRISSSTRVETFSDGVFAIAITLLVLDLRAPEHPETFLSDLAAQWPSYLAFTAAFAVLGLIWLSHHDLFSRLRGANSSLLQRNLLLLFPVSLFAFPTAVLAASFGPGETSSNQLAAIGIFDLTAIAITLAWAHLARVLLAAPQLASDLIDATRYARRQTLFAGVACALLGMSFAIGYLSPITSIVLIALLPLINIGFHQNTQHAPAEADSQSTTESGAA